MTAEERALSLPRTGLIALAFLAAGTLGVVAAWVFLDHSIGYRYPVLYSSLGTICGTITGAAATLALLRRRDARRDLGLTRPDGRHLLVGLLAGVGIFAAFAALRWSLTGAPLVPGWTATYAAHRELPLTLFLEFIVLSPLVGECFFRGLLHRGMAASPLGPTGAIGVGAVLYAILLAPSDLLEALEGLAVGIFLGVLRERSGSAVPGIAATALLAAITLVLASTRLAP